MQLARLLWARGVCQDNGNDVEGALVAAVAKADS